MIDYCSSNFNTANAGPNPCPYFADSAACFPVDCCTTTDSLIKPQIDLQIDYYNKILTSIYQVKNCNVSCGSKVTSGTVPAQATAVCDIALYLTCLKKLNSADGLVARTACAYYTNDLACIPAACCNDPLQKDSVNHAVANNNAALVTLGSTNCPVRCGAPSYSISAQDGLRALLPRLLPVLSILAGIWLA